MITYQNKDVKVKVIYKIESTSNQKVFDSMEKVNFDFNDLHTREYDTLEDAIMAYIKLSYSQATLHVNLQQQIVLNGEVIQEQSICNIHPDLEPRTTDKFDNMKECFETQKNIIEGFILKYNCSGTYNKYIKELAYLS